MSGPYTAQIQRAIRDLVAGNIPWNGSQVPAAANTYDLGSSALPWRTVYAQAVALGTNPATAGAVRLANSDAIKGRNAANTANIQMIGTTSSNLIELGDGGFNIRINDPMFPSGALDFGTLAAPWNNVYGTAYHVGGTAGIDFSGAVTNITVVKGIVTAAS